MQIEYDQQIIFCCPLFANNMSHGLKKKQSLGSDDDEVDDTQPGPKRQKLTN